jgi:tetratricopeptide (TPR) repeat protein
MSGVFRSVTAAAVALAFGTTVLAAPSSPPPPRPKIDCSKAENQKKKACANKHRELSDDDLFYAGYWLARKGDYALALHYLNQAANENDVRILTYIGFTTRKLGDVDKAMGYYHRAIAIDANYTTARAYMGEAFLQKGNRAGAEEQLVEIGRRCGVACDEYKELAEALAKHSSKG